MKETYKINTIERKVGKRFTKEAIPSGKEICERQLLSLIGRIQKVDVNEKEIERFLPAILDKLSGMDREQLIKHFVSIEFNRFLSFYQDAQDLNVRDRHREEQRKGMEFNTFSINFGKNDNFGVKALFKIINDQRPLKGVQLGQIDIQRNQTLFQVDKKYENLVLKCLNNGKIFGRKISIRKER